MRPSSSTFWARMPPVKVNALVGVIA